MVSSPKKYKYHQKYKCPKKCPFLGGGGGGRRWTVEKLQSQKMCGVHTFVTIKLKNADFSCFKISGVNGVLDIFEEV